MEQMIRKLDKKVIRVTMLRKAEDGSRAALPVYSELSATLSLPRKKQTGVYKFLEKRTRKSANKGLKLLDTYLALHEYSNRRKKNGWAKDYFKNSKKAVRKTFND